MQHVYLIPPEPSPEEMQRILVEQSYARPFGVIVTRPKDLTLAKELAEDVLQMFGSTTDEAIATAWQITRAADQPVAVIIEGK